LRYGREQERYAKKEYSHKTGHEVWDSGLVIKIDQPWLCASPDGFVLDGEEPFILEVKCPSSCKGEKISVKYLDTNGNLKINDPYYTQVQVQMYWANVSKCHFFVYSSVDSVLTAVKRDNAFL